MKDTLVEVGSQAAEEGIQPGVVEGIHPGEVAAGEAPAGQSVRVAVELDRLAGEVAVGEGKAQSRDRERAESQQ